MAGGKPRVSVMDYDNDGLIDIAMTRTAIQINGTEHNGIGIFKNNSPTNGNHYIKFKVRGRGHNSTGLNTLIRVYQAGTTKLLGQRQLLITGYSDNATEVHFGLGSATHVDIDVVYPNNGPSYKRSNLAADQIVLLYPNDCIKTNYQPGQDFALKCK